MPLTRPPIEHKGQPTVILAKTIKGYGLGEAGEGRNITHQQKKMNEKELREFRARFDIPITDEEVVETPFYRPAVDSPETQVLARTAQSAGRIFAGTRSVEAQAARDPGPEHFTRVLQRIRPVRSLHDDGASCAC